MTSIGAGTGPLFDHHHVYAEAQAMRSKLPGTDMPRDVQPEVASRKNASMMSVDAHNTGCRRDWPAVDHRPYAPKVFESSRSFPQRDHGRSSHDYRTAAENISSMTRKERIHFLERMDKLEDSAGSDGKEPFFKEPAYHAKFADTIAAKAYSITGSSRLTARRAYNERQISGRDALIPEVGDRSSPAVPTRKPLQSRQLNIKAALNDPNFDIDDGFNKAVELRKEALRHQAKSSGLDSAARPVVTAAVDLDVPGRSSPSSASKRQEFNGFTVPALPSTSLASRTAPVPPADLNAPTSVSSPGRRQYPKVSAAERKAAAVQRAIVPVRDERPDVEAITSCLKDLEVVLSDTQGQNALDDSSRSQAANLVKLAKQIQSWAYSLRPNDSLDALRLLARSSYLLDSYQKAAVASTFDTAIHKIGMIFEDALSSVQSALEAILAAVCMRITTSEAPYVVDILFAMAETRSGRQEYLDALLGHILWLLAATPRSFTPMVVARGFWALGLLKMEAGAQGDMLSLNSKDANRRAIIKLQERLVEILDDFLEDELGTLAMDPTGGALLGDVELRRVLHRAGRLQVGLRPDSSRFLGAMQRLESSARTRLWQPFQADIMPFMCDYCDELFAAESEAPPPAVRRRDPKAWLPPSLR